MKFFPWWELTPSNQVLRSKMLKTQHKKLVAEGGWTNHSAQGHTLRTMITRLEEDGIPYILTAFPGKGYSIQVKPPGEREL